MVNEEDDLVVQEIDVYLVKSLVEKLYLFQYFVCLVLMIYDDILYFLVKIKFKQQKVEFEMVIDILNFNYCCSKGEQIVLNVDGVCVDEISMYFLKLMDKQIFCFFQIISNIFCYVVVFYR